jgi:cyclopropane fatty-acyl-phospholipid synthase-like methyltransferase
MDVPGRSDPTYVMDYSAEEREQLIQQAGHFGPITEHFLRTAGLDSGMRVLDAGCGAGRRVRSESSFRWGSNCSRHL